MVAKDDLLCPCLPGRERVPATRKRVEPERVSVLTGAPYGPLRSRERRCFVVDRDQARTIRYDASERPHHGFLRIAHFTRTPSDDRGLPECGTQRRWKGGGNGTGRCDGNARLHVAEQVKGKPADQRSDIFSFGAIGLRASILNPSGVRLSSRPFLRPLRRSRRQQPTRLPALPLKKSPEGPRLRRPATRPVSEGSSIRETRLFGAGKNRDSCQIQTPICPACREHCVRGKLAHVPCLPQLNPACGGRGLSRLWHG
jgi:hypothetical protein